MTELLSAADIAELTAIDESAMNESFTITDVTLVSDGAGSSTEQESTRTVVGYLWSASGSEAGEDQVKALGSHRLAIPKTTAAVAPTARITQQSTGKVFNIVYVFPITSYSTSLMLGLEDRS